MTRHSRSVTSRSKSLPTLLAILCSSLLALAVLGDQIINDVDDNTLTSRTHALTATNVQGVVPQEFHRGVNIDGTLRDRMLWQLIQFEGNPFPESWNANRVQTGVRLHNGTYEITDIDLFIPASVPWPIGRSYNARQDDGSHLDSNGYQGRNWFQMSQPELVYVDDNMFGFDDLPTADDRLYLVYGADRFIEFKRLPDSEPWYDEYTFVAVNGANGIVEINISGGPDTATYYDGKRNKMTFFWFDDADIPDNKEGQIWKITDTDGSFAYAGHATNSTTALSSGYNSDGTIKEAFDSNSPPNKFVYTYSVHEWDSVSRLDKVNVSNNGTDIDYFVEYIYSTDEDEFGNLELVKITTPEIKAVTNMEPITTYYRYWTKTAFDDTTNPGHQYGLQYIVGPEGTRNFDYEPAGSWDQDYLTATETILKPYALAYFEYDSSHRIDKSWFNGECGCSGANNGINEFSYTVNTGYTDTTGYTTTWESRTEVNRPDGSFITQYFDETGQTLSRVISDGDPGGAPTPTYWVTKVDRDLSGLEGFIDDIHSPANVTAYTHSTASFTTSTSAGLVNRFKRLTSGDAKGYINHWKHEKGTSGSEYLDRTVYYEIININTGSGGNISRAFNDCIWVYEQETTTEVTSCTMGSPPSGSLKTDFTNGIFNTSGAELIAEKITTTFPAVTTAKNGSNASLTRIQEFREDGSLVFTEFQDGSVDYTGIADGLNSRGVGDADDGFTGDFLSGDGGRMEVDEYGGTDGGNRVITETEFDALGRPTASIIDEYASTTLEVQRTETYRSMLKDGRTVTLVYPHVNPTTPTYYGPVRYRVTNRAGKVEAQGLISLESGGSPVESLTTAQSSHVDETDDDPITAIDGIGVLSQLTVSVFDETGTSLQESRPNFNIPSSGDGTDGTNYDATFFGYDDMGRRKRVKDPTGTIRLTVFDEIGRVSEQQIGTNDPDETGDDDMVKIIEHEYDSDGVGNGYLTKRTLFVVDSATDSRITTFAHDVQGRVLLQANPEEPENILNKYDNMGRVLASGQYSTGTVASTDDPTSRTTDRMTLSQSFYDELGRVWKSQTHKIDQADGSDDDNLQTLNWYDPRGRLIKTDGSQLRKTRYDRLGRVSHDFILADDNDTTYAHVYDSTNETTDLAGDIVLQESQNTYDPLDGNLLMVGVIARKSSDIATPTGELDTDADTDEYLYTAANVQGHIRITVNWYEDNVFSTRLTDTVRYGDNGGSNFDLENVAGGVFDQIAVPSRSDTALLTERAFFTEHALLKSTTDPMDLETRIDYDDAGRRITTIANYVNGTPSGSTGDDDVHTRFVYTDGLQTKIFVDVDGDDVEDTEDQVTEYTFGTTKGVSAGDSKIGTGHLLQKVQYPESTGGTDVVTFAYNAQSQQIWTKDQEGNIIETDFDDLGRETHRRATTIDADFDNAIKRISTAYNDRGLRENVTQYDNATVGSGTVQDEVEFTYDGWTKLTKYEQDNDSVVGAGGTPNDFEVSYAYAKATGGRNTLRRTSMTHPDGTQVDYVYDTASSNDDDASRVSQLKISSTSYVQYAYRGVGSLVRIDYPEPDLFMTTDSGTYLDNFDRVTKSRWTKDLATDLHYYEFDITYDRNSNITVTEDNIFNPTVSGVVGFDVSYTVDGLNRLNKAEEGDWTGSSIGTRARQQIWTLDQIGNWDIVKWDVNGDNDFIDTGEYNDDRTHIVVNELTARDTDDDGTDDFTLTYDAVGNITDDGEDYEYEYDVFGRLRTIKNTSTQALVSEYTYNGMNHRIAYHQDTDADGDVDANDVWFHNSYNERWQLVAVFHEDEAANDSDDPKEQFIYHNAGLDGTGGSSYIDNVVLRDRDHNTAWNLASDGVREKRNYYCHNWRNDMIALLTDLGAMEEWYKYSSYGRPYGIIVGDCNASAVVNVTDLLFMFSGWGTTTQAKVTADTNLDGNINVTDQLTQSANWGAKLGFDSLSFIGNRKGYAGYELDDVLSAAANLYHVRNRVLHADLGRWMRRDPLGYVDGWNLYEYVFSNPLVSSDAQGTDVPGCDPPADIFNDSCGQRCCASHDACYDAHNCRAFDPLMTGMCTVCDIVVVVCMALCNINPDHNRDLPRCYCHKTGEFYDVPEGERCGREEECACIEPDCGSGDIGRDSHITIDVEDDGVPDIFIDGIGGGDRLGEALIHAYD